MKTYDFRQFRFIGRWPSRPRESGFGAVPGRISG